MEQYNSFVSSRGLLKSCMIRNTKPISSAPVIDFSRYNTLQAGATIHVCQDAVGLFADHILDSITAPFVLLSGDSDTPANEALPGFDKLLSHPLLLAWYAQNLTARADKLFHLPIGLDYHTAWETVGHFELETLSPMRQESGFKALIAGAKDWTARIPLAYCNWHFFLRGERAECQAKVDPAACYYEPQRIARHQSWRNQAEFMFTLSPEGGGMDCHRTWEGLLLGAIPVVRRNALAPLFADLPVVIVEDWAEVTPDFLVRTAAEMAGRTYDFSSLMLRHWQDRIQSRLTDDSFAGLTLDQFRRLIA